VLLDLDGFKQLNDRCGHAAGDQALRAVGEILRSSVRRADQAARLGGDELAILMPAAPPAAAMKLAERIRRRVESLPVPGGCQLSASLGVATAGPSGGPSGAELLRRADVALYAAKHAGKNRVVASAA
jgi:two-component system cell cycle response regulator